MSQFLKRKAGHPPTQFGELNQFLTDLVQRIKDILGDNFIGAYLQGSFALGDADEFSDCDFLVVIRSTLTRSQVRDLKLMHEEIRSRTDRWSQNTEGSYAPRDELRGLTGLGKKWLYIDQGVSGNPMEYSTHCNSAVVRWILQGYGVTLAGPPPNSLIEQVGADVLRADARKNIETFLPDMLTWIGLDSPWAQRYAVTTLCRLLYRLHTGRVASKRASLLWAGDNLDPKWQELITGALEGRALGWNHADPSLPQIQKEIREFNEFARTLSNRYPVVLASSLTRK